MTSAKRQSLLAAHDALLVDLDGVVRLADQAIPGAADALADARAADVAIMFVTNNAAMTPSAVAAGLREIGVAAGADDVLTSSMAAAELLAQRLPRGSRVLVVGGEGLRGPLQDQGLTPVATAGERPVAVVQGWSPDLTWALLAEAAVAVREGAVWVATNRDATLPSPRGPLPGNGAMVQTVVMATGHEPEVVGKPGPALFTTAAHRLGASRPLVVGDRLDTDIAGANAAGMPSLLVLTGVSTADDLLAAPPGHRPTYVGANLGALGGPAVAVCDDTDVGDALDELRARCRAAWGDL